MSIREPAIVLRELRQLPGGRELLELAAERDDVELVGGAVRDLLLGVMPRELDVALGGDEQAFTREAPLFARDLASSLGALSGANEHARFGTALVEWEGGRIDIATRRAESYPAPGALPEVRAGTPEQDLERRDFTVNAIAIGLGGKRLGELRAVSEDAPIDLEHGRLRVLHDASFTDDPTRLLRLARYRARLGFEIERHTARLAARAVSAHALDTISGSRVGVELRLALAEPDAPGALAAMDELGLLSALHPRLRLDRQATERALALLGEYGRPDLLMLAALTLPLAIRAGEDPRSEIAALLDRLEFAAVDRDRVATAAVAVPRLMSELPAASRPSRLRAAVEGTPPEGIALAGGVHEAAAAPARRWLTDLHDVRLAITGDDLLAAGVPEGPEIGRRLDVTLDRKLDGRLTGGRDAELREALEA